MKRLGLVVIALSLCLCGCIQKQANKEILHRDFFNTVWERFDYVTNEVEIKEATSYNLSMRISFTDDYPYEDFSMIFTVFDDKENPYRSKAYRFTLKDSEGNWNVEKVNDCYTFTLPINKQLSIVDPGKYKFQIEQKQPITPLVGVKQLILLNN